MIVILLLAILCTTSDPPTATWIDDRRATVAWSQTASDLACLSKVANGYAVFLGCEPGTPGMHQAVLGAPGGDAAFLPHPGDRYWVDLYQDGRWVARSGVGELGARPVRVWLPLILQPPPADR